MTDSILPFFNEGSSWWPDRAAPEDWGRNAFTYCPIYDRLRGAEWHYLVGGEVHIQVDVRGCVITAVMKLMAGCHIFNVDYPRRYVILITERVSWSRYNILHYSVKDISPIKNILLEIREQYQNKVISLAGLLKHARVKNHTDCSPRFTRQVKYSHKKRPSISVTIQLWFRPHHNCYVKGHLRNVHGCSLEKSVEADKATTLREVEKVEATPVILLACLTTPMTLMENLSGQGQMRPQSQLSKQGQKKASLKNKKGKKRIWVKATLAKSKQLSHIHLLFNFHFVCF